jgi:hypothetical protein
MTGIVPPLGELVPGHSWLIWSNAHAGFLNAASTGYTRLIEKAGRFTNDDVIAYVSAEKAKPLVHGKLNAVAIADYALSTPISPGAG